MEGMVIVKKQQNSSGKKPEPAVKSFKFNQIIYAFVH